MAEHGKGGILAKAQKQLFRTKAKVLQNLGKAEKTTDTAFDDYVTNFAKLQGSVAKLQKELKNYILCAKGMAVASKSFCDILLELYETDWTRDNDFRDSINSIELLWNDYLVRLESQVGDPIAIYLSHFPGLKTKVAKRGRKLVDYDSARHSIEALLNAKKKDETKVSKAKEELNEAKRIYEDLNRELLAELPNLNDSRGAFYASSFQSLFSAESIFHENLGQVNSTLSDVADKLAKDNLAHVFVASSVRPVSKTDSLGSRSSRSEPSISNGSDRVTNPEPDRTPNPEPASNLYVEPQEDIPEEANEQETTETIPEESGESGGGQIRLGQDYENISVKRETASTGGTNGEQHTHSSIQNNVSEKERRSHSSSVTEKEGAGEEKPTNVYPVLNTEDHEGEDEDSEDEKHLYQVPTSNEPVATPPPGVLFQVCATHPYVGEDSDELSFEAGEVVFVIEHEDPDEQDDGWLMGIRQSDGRKGVFPENFTKRM